jgi:antitoxin component YwqK of YwqJK toxin-antitoxin module
MLLCFTKYLMMHQLTRCSAILLFFISSCSKKFDGKNGTRTIYYEGTDKVSQSIEYKNGKKEGWWLEFYENGNPKVKSFYVNDSLQDSSVYHHKNGALSDIQFYKKGKREGCWKKFNEKGMLVHEANYMNNYKEGISKTYTYNSGRLLEQLNFKEGIKEGKQEYFYNSGKPKCVCYFHNNHPCLGLQEWTESGKKINTDFKISISELNRVLLENKLKLIVRLEHSQHSDEVCEVEMSDSDSCFTGSICFSHEGDQFNRDYYVYKHGFVMRKITIAAMRKTGLGNVMIKTANYNLSATNF